MTATGGIVLFGVVLVIVALASSRWTPLVGIGGLLILLGVARILMP